ncbi:hypothetical protein ES703_74141 [subsurface metagenome]
MVHFFVRATVVESIEVFPGLDTISQLVIVIAEIQRNPRIPIEMKDCWGMPQGELKIERGIASPAVPIGREIEAPAEIYEDVLNTILNKDLRKSFIS